MPESRHVTRRGSRPRWPRHRGSRSRTARSAPRSSSGLRAAIGTPSRRQIARCAARFGHPRGRDRAAAPRRAPRAAARSARAHRRSSRSPRVTPSRRTTPLRNAVAFAGSSTAFTKTRRGSAAAATPRLTSGVAAATTSQTPSRSAGSNARAPIGTPAPLDVGMDLRRHDRHVGAGGEQLRQLRRRRRGRRRRAGHGGRRGSRRAAADRPCEQVGRPFQGRRTANKKSPASDVLPGLETGSGAIRLKCEISITTTLDRGSSEPPPDNNSDRRTLR